MCEDITSDEQLNEYVGRVTVISKQLTLLRRLKKPKENKTEIGRLASRRLALKRKVDQYRKRNDADKAVGRVITDDGRILTTEIFNSVHKAHLARNRLVRSLINKGELSENSPYGIDDNYTRDRY